MATVWPSGFGCVTKAPDGGTATGAGGCVIRTPDGGTVTGACATSVGLGVWPWAIDVPASNPRQAQDRGRWFSTTTPKAWSQPVIRGVDQPTGASQPAVGQSGEVDAAISTSAIISSRRLQSDIRRKARKRRQPSSEVTTRCSRFRGARPNHSVKSMTSHPDTGYSRQHCQ